MNLLELSNIFLNAIIAFIILVFVLPYKLKWHQYILVFFFIFVSMAFFSSKNHILYFFIIGPAFGFIILFSPQRLLGFFCLLFSFLCSVLVYYFYSAAIYILFQRKVVCIALINEHTLLLKAIYLVLLLAALLKLRYFLFRKLKITQLMLSARILRYIFANILMCTAIFILNFSYGATKSYPSELISLNYFLFGIYFIISTIVLLLVVKTLKNDYEAKQKAAHYDILCTYTLQLEETFQDARTFLVDYANILSTLYTYIIEKDFSGFETYFINDILHTKEPFESNNLELSKFANIKIPELKGILTTKAVHSINLNLHLNVNIPSLIKTVQMDTLDLSRLLGIYLDNAIEAASSTESKTLTISILTNNKKISIMIANSCLDTNLPINMLTRYGVSTKGINRGLGLYNAARILDKYPDVMSRTYCRNCVFTQIIENI